MNLHSVTMWRSPKIYILCAAFCVVVIPLTSLVTRGEDSNSTASNEHVDTFVKLANEMKITKAEMYYCPWGAMPYAPISEESQLTESYSTCQTTMNGLEVIALADDIANTLSTVKYKKIQPSKVDLRIGCHFYTKDRRVLRVFISKDVPAVFINGIPYRVTPAIVDTLLPMLPVYAYRSMYKSMINDWASPAYRKKITEPQQESGDR